MTEPMRFLEIDSEKWPPRARAIKPAPVRIWLSQDFLVQLYDEAGGIQRLTVCTTSLGDNERWVDGISWDELQGIKDALGFHDRDAVEIYPKRADVVNVANMRHLWLLSDELPFVWRNADK